MGAGRALSTGWVEDGINASRSTSTGWLDFSRDSGFSVTDVDLDEDITSGQTGVIIQVAGKVAASGKRVFITQGANRVEQTVTAENAFSITITVTYGGLLTAGAATLSVLNPL